MIPGLQFDAPFQTRFDELVRLARIKLASARLALGDDLSGFSVTDLLADNFDWPLEICKQIAKEIS